ncbi:MAG TPA: STAS domain-containing protein [Mycobacteriales bacterium]|nr:STAS domain-containing protein [Mycobacteriales bacterium]
MTASVPTGIVDGHRIALCGRLDARTATVTRAELHAAVLDGAGDLVVDMSGVESLDAVGLGVLVGTRRLAFRHDRTLLLDGCTPAVARVLRVTGLHGILTRQRDGRTVA